MSVWRHLTHGLRVLTHRTAADHDLAQELEDYLEHTSTALEATGLTPEEARRSARRELGNAMVIREQVRSDGWENVVSTLLFDLRYAIRHLSKNPGFATTAILILALGIGATTAIFSAVNPILFEPLPFPNADQVTSILEVHADGSRTEGTFAMYHELAERSRSFSAIAVLKPWQPAMIGRDQPERLEGQRVSSSYFQVLGVAPAMGRDFAPSEDRFHGPNVVILSDALWRRRFVGDPAIIGRQIRLEEARGSAGDNLYVVIGVMPKRFENVLDPAAELWALLQYNPQDIADRNSREWGHHLRTVGRLRPEVSAKQGALEVNGLGRELIKALKPETYDPNTQFTVTSLHSELTRSVRPALLAVLGAVLLVLLIACVNVSNLLLARGAQRRGEFAMRAALGAEPMRMIRQLLTESLLLGAVGGVLGILVAELGIFALVALSPPGLPRAGAIRMNSAVFFFSLLVTTLVGLVVGLMPAVHASRSDPHGALQQSSRSTLGSHQLTRRMLVVSEVALALVLLVSAGLLLRSLERLFAVDIGFDGSHLLTMQLEGAGPRFSDDRATNQFFKQVVEAVRRLPGIDAAGLTRQLPLSGDLDQYGAHFEANGTQPAETYPIFRYVITPGYIETMRIALRSGRLFNDHDGPATPFVALISQSLAKARFHGSDPLGQRLIIGATGPYTIVGVVGDVKQASLALSETDAVYIPNTQWRWAENVLSLVIRTRGSGTTLVPAIRHAIWAIDKDVPIVRVATMEDVLATSEAQRRFALIIFEAFALVALVLAAVGIYGVLSGSVAERLREIGVRAALGASRGGILALVIRQGMTLTLMGVAIGLLGSAAASQAIAAMLFGVSRLDFVTYFGVFTLLSCVSLLACGIPAWRAAQVDPAITLRAE